MCSVTEQGEPLWAPRLPGPHQPKPRPQAQGSHQRLFGLSLPAAAGTPGLSPGRLLPGTGLPGPEPGHQGRTQQSLGTKDPALLWMMLCASVSLSGNSYLQQHRRDKGRSLALGRRSRPQTLDSEPCGWLLIPFRCFSQHPLLAQHSCSRARSQASSAGLGTQVHCEDHGAQKCSLKRGVPWHDPVILATQEAEAGEQQV